jgi:hypothetical protein
MDSAAHRRTCSGEWMKLTSDGQLVRKGIRSFGCLIAQFYSLVYLINGGLDAFNIDARVGNLKTRTGIDVMRPVSTVPGECVIRPIPDFFLLFSVASSAHGTELNQLTECTRLQEHIS